MLNRRLRVREVGEDALQRLLTLLHSGVVAPQNLAALVGQRGIGDEILRIIEAPSKFTFSGIREKPQY